LLGRPSNRPPPGPWCPDLHRPSRHGPAIWSRSSIAGRHAKASGEVQRAGEAAAARLREVFLEPGLRALLATRLGLPILAGCAPSPGRGSPSPRSPARGSPCAAALNDGPRSSPPRPADVCTATSPAEAEGRIASTAAPPEARRLCTVGASVPRHDPPFLRPFLRTLACESAGSTSGGSPVPRRMPAGRNDGDSRRQETAGDTSVYKGSPARARIGDFPL